MKYSSFNKAMRFFDTARQSQQIGSLVGFSYICRSYPERDQNQNIIANDCNLVKLSQIDRLGY